MGYLVNLAKNATVTRGSDGAGIGYEIYPIDTYLSGRQALLLCSIHFNGIDLRRVSQLRQ